MVSKLKKNHASFFLKCLGTLLILGALPVRVMAFFTSQSDWDEYAFALVAREIMQGRLPYTGIFDNKPVGLYYLFVISYVLWGINVFALRFLSLISSLCAAFLIYKTARLFVREDNQSALFPFLISAIYLALSLSNGGYFAMSELLVNPLLALSIYLLALWLQKKINTKMFGFWGGFTFGIASQITYLVIPMSVLMGVGYLICAKKIGESTKHLLIAVILGMVGFIISFSLFLIPHYISGDLANYFLQQFRYHQTYLAFTEWSNYLIGFIKPLVVLCLPIIILLIPFIKSKREATSSEKKMMIINLFFLLGGLYAASLSGRLYPHYFLLLLPSVCICTYLLLLRLNVAQNLLAISLSLFFPALLVLSGLVTYAKWIHSPAIEEEVADYIQKNTAQQDFILIFNESHSIYFLSGRYPVNRYVFPFLYMDKSMATTLGISPEFILNEALAKKPVLIAAGNLYKNEINFDLNKKLVREKYVLSDLIKNNDREIALYKRVND